MSREWHMVQVCVFGAANREGIDCYVKVRRSNEHQKWIYSLLDDRGYILDRIVCPEVERHALCERAAGVLVTRVSELTKEMGIRVAHNARIA